MAPVKILLQKQRQPIAEPPYLQPSVRNEDLSNDKAPHGADTKSSTENHSHSPTPTRPCDPACSCRACEKLPEAGQKPAAQLHPIQACVLLLNEKTSWRPFPCQGSIHFKHVWIQGIYLASRFCVTNHDNFKSSMKLVPVVARQGESGFRITRLSEHVHSNLPAPGATGQTPDLAVDGGTHFRGGSGCSSFSIHVPGKKSDQLVRKLWKQILACQTQFHRRQIQECPRTGECLSW